MMDTFKANRRALRYRDLNSPGDRNHCYDSSCKDEGKELVDFLARWEDVGAFRDGAPIPDAIIFTCVDHQSGFDEAKDLFHATQKSHTAVYFTKDEWERNRF